MRDTILVVLLCCAACSLPAETTALSAQTAAFRNCAIDGIPGVVRCGTVRVAESPDAAAGRQIDLRVIVAAAHSGAPLGDPVVPLAGGPGQGAADLAVMMAQRYAFLRERRDIVLIDQRGTGASNGLHCTPAAKPAELMGKLFDAARLADCRDQLAKRADLTKYSTQFAAADYARVFDQLGYRDVNIIGVSYGTRLGLELARRMPSRVRTLTLEGVAPSIPFEWPKMAAPDNERALRLLIEDCAADAGCRDSYPRFQLDVDRAFTRLAQAPVNVTVTDPMTAVADRVTFGTTDMAYALRGLLYGNEALSLPKWFREAAAGRFDAFAQAYVRRARTLDAQVATGVHLGVYCAEDVPFVDWVAAQQLARNTRLGTYLLDQYRRACEIWPRAPATASAREPVRSAVPALLMSGRRDPVTPPRTAEEAAKTLPNAKVLIWRYGAHGTDGLSSRDCRINIQRAFVQSGRSDALPTGCATRDPTLPFAR